MAGATRQRSRSDEVRRVVLAPADQGRGLRVRLAVADSREAPPVGAGAGLPTCRGATPASVSAPYPPRRTSSVSARREPSRPTCGGSPTSKPTPLARSTRDREVARKAQCAGPNQWRGLTAPLDAGPRHVEAANDVASGVPSVATIKSGPGDRSRGTRAEVSERVTARRIRRPPPLGATRRSRSQLACHSHSDADYGHENAPGASVRADRRVG